MIRILALAVVAAALSAQTAVPRPIIGVQDHVSCYWPTNFRQWVTWPNYMKVRYVNAGTYGLTFDTSTGSIDRLGPLANPGGSAEAAAQLDHLVTSLAPTGTHQGPSAAERLAALRERIRARAADS